MYRFIFLSLFALLPMTNIAQPNLITSKLKRLSFEDKATACISVSGLLAAAVIFSQKNLPSPDEAFVGSALAGTIGFAVATILDVYFPEESFQSEATNLQDD